VCRCQDNAGGSAAGAGQFEPRHLIRRLPLRLSHRLGDDLAHPQPAAPSAAVPAQPVRMPGVIGRRQLGQGQARMPCWRLLAHGGRLDLEPQASLGHPKPIAAQVGRWHREPQRAHSDGARDPDQRMPPLSAHVPVPAGWSWPGRRLRAAGPAESERLAGLPHRSLGTFGADQAKHRECMRHGLDAGGTDPTTPKRPCLRQGLDHQPQVDFGSNSHSHSLAGHASPLNQADLDPLNRGPGPDGALAFLVAETVAATRSLTHLIAANEGSGVKALIARSADTGWPSPPPGRTLAWIGGTGSA
jgi:hypothetical protein